MAYKIAKVLLLIVASLCYPTAYGERPYTQDQQIKDLLVLLSRHDRLLTLSPEFRGHPWQIFNMASQILPHLSIHAHTLGLRNSIMKITSHYPVGMVSHRETSRIRKTLKEALDIVCKTHITLHKDLQTTLARLAHDPDLEHAFLLLTPFLFFEDGRRRFDSIESGFLTIKDKMTRLDYREFLSLYNDFYLNHLSPQIKPIADKEQRWQTQHDHLTHRFINETLNNAPITLLRHVDFGKDRTITLEEEASPIFATVRGFWGPDCCPTTAPLFSLLKNTRTFKIHFGATLGSVPAGYVFLVEIPFEGQTTPYILNLNGQKLTKQDIRHILTQIAVVYGHRFVIIPDLSKNDYLSNFPATTAVFKSYTFSDVSVTLPQGWSIVAQTRWSTAGYFDPRKLKDARLIEIPKQQFDAMARLLPQRQVPHPYPSCEAIRSQSAFHRAFIAATIVKEHPHLLNKLVGLLQKAPHEPFDQYIQLCLKLANLGTHHPSYNHGNIAPKHMPWGLFRQIQQTFSKNTGEKLALRSVLDVLEPSVATESFNAIARHPEGAKLLSRQSWVRLAGTLFSRLEREPPESRARFRYSLFDMLRRKHKQITLCRPPSRQILITANVADFFSTIERAFQQKKHMPEPATLRQLANTYLAIYHYSPIPKHKRNGFLLRALKTATPHRAVLTLGTIYSKFQNHLSLFQWSDVVGFVFENLDFEDSHLFKSHFSHDDELETRFSRSVAVIHPLLPSATKRIVLKNLAQYGHGADFKDYVLGISQSDPVFLRKNSNTIHSILENRLGDHADRVATRFDWQQDTKDWVVAFLTTRRHLTPEARALSQSFWISGPGFYLLNAAEGIKELHTLNPDLFSALEWQILADRVFEQIKNRFQERSAQLDPTDPSFLEQNRGLVLERFSFQFQLYPFVSRGHKLQFFYETQQYFECAEYYAREISERDSTPISQWVNDHLTEIIKKFPTPPSDAFEAELSTHLALLPYADRDMQQRFASWVTIGVTQNMRKKIQQIPKFGCW